MKKKAKKLKKIKKKKKSASKIDIDQILLKGRELFLFKTIDEKITIDIVRKLIALDKINNNPILLWINSGGGSIIDGFSIIDTMKAIKSPVVTIISGMAASMAGIISITGSKRFMTKNSIWMAHDGRTGIVDYFEKVFDRTDFIKELNKRLFKILREYTKLSERELTKSRHGELWIYAEDAKKKGIVDIVV